MTRSSNTQSSRSTAPHSGAKANAQPSATAPPHNQADPIDINANIAATAIALMAQEGKPW
ncbi:hypothetical protein GCM10010428_72010 [Actinosynnema pretiosum subsp. pretiosum]